jgi:sugar lactone lactonase YvrE
VATLAPALLAIGAATPCFALKTATAITLTVTSEGIPESSVASGTVVTLTAKVTTGATPVTPGLVNFCDATAAYCEDIHIVGTAQLTSAGTAAIKFRPGIGSHSYKAVFVGTNTYATSASGASALAVTGAIAPLATAATINQTGSWGAYALSATVTEAGNTAPPTGTVSFLDTNHGNAVLGTGTLGSATRGVAWTSANTSAPNLAGVSYSVADLNGDGIPDLFVEDYFGTYDVFLGNGDGTFTEKGSAFGPSSETGGFIVGDFNNDGIPDVAAINASYYAPNNTITIFLGNGDGTFTVAGSSPALGYNPTAIATADINGDGIADLIVVQQGTSSSSGGQVVIFFGNGDGTFTQAPSTTSVPSVVSSVLPADLNGDGHVDLVVSGSGGSGVTILLGKGDGTFTSVAGPTQSGEATVAVADVNNDGIPDLVFGAATTSNLTVFLGNGDGTFTETPSSLNASLVIGNSVAIADLNQDGIPDVVYSNGATTGVLFGKGDGTFVQFPTTLSFSTYGFGTAFVVADFNGDGWPDVLAIDGSGRTIADSLTQPTETVTASATVSIASAGAHLVDTSYPGDSNYDASASGTVSLWGAQPATTTTLAITSGGSPVTSVPSGSVVVLTATVVAVTSPVTTGQVNFCDASANSCTDIHLLGTVYLTSNGTAAFKFVPGPGTHSYKAIFVEDGSGLSSSSTALTLTVGSQPEVYSDATTITAGGSPGDYSLTANVVGYGGSITPTGTVSFLDTSFGNSLLATAALGPSTAGQGWLIAQTPAVTDSPIAEVRGDFNGDGIPDLALLWAASTYNGPPSVTILLGKGDGTFTTGATVQVTGAQGYPAMIAGDFNGDGKTDLAVLSWNSYSTSYITTLLGNGDGTFGAPQTGTAFNEGIVGGDGVPGSLVAADFNGDGKLDLAIVGDYVAPGGVTILLGKGDGTFQPAGPNLDPTADFGLIATGDFNGDGIPDLVATNYFEFGKSPVVFLGRGDGTFTQMPTSFTLDYFPTSVAVADFNGDGVLDLAFSDLNGVEIALGNGDGTFKETAASPIAVSSELYSLVAGDFNHDGKTDLAGVDSYGDRIVLLNGAGDGTFTTAAATPAVSTDWLGPFAIVAADFNGDGVPDLAMLTKNATTVSILLNEPTQTATATVNGIAPVGAGTHNVDASYGGDSTYSSSLSGAVALSAGLTPIVFSPAAGTYSTVQTITLSESIPSATIYYSASGVINTSGFVAYTTPIQLAIGGAESIQAYATESGYQQSNYTTAIYTMNLPTAPAPVFSIGSGSYSSAQTVTITDSASSTNIFYTTNGRTPTQYSTPYTGPITVSASETLAAVALGGGYSPSAATVAQYLIASSSVPFIYTIAGNESFGLAGDGGPATVASLNDPFASVVDGAGNLYVSDTVNNVIRKVAATTGIITTYAGTGSYGYSGDSGAATSATLSIPEGLAIDSAGNLYICDLGNKVVRMVAASTGNISTVAGNPTSTTQGNGGPATSAQLIDPTGVALDASGNIYISTQLGGIRKVTAATGTISTVAGGSGLGYTGDNGPAINATFFNPQGLAVDGAGNIFIADTGNNVIREVNAATQIIITVAGNKPASGITYPFGGDGGPATSAFISSPYAVAVDSSGDLFIADTANNAIREVTASNQIINTIAGAPPTLCTTLSGDGGPAADAGVCQPTGVALDSAGNVYIAEGSASRIRKVTAPAPPPATAAAAPVFSVSQGSYPGTQTVSITDATPGAEIYVTTDGSTPTTAGAGYRGTINVTGTATLKALAVAPGYVESTVTAATYTILTPPSTLISTVAGSGAFGSTGSGSVATSQQFEYPQGVATDSSGNFYIADFYNQVVWKVSSSGSISVAAGILGEGGILQNGILATSAALSGPSHVAVDSAGNLYISDTYHNEIRVVSATTGIISAFAGGGTTYNAPYGDGGPATSAYLSSPQGITFDNAGNLYIADAGHNTIRMVATRTGVISTVAGTTGTSNNGLGDGGPATSALLANPFGVAFDSQNNMYIADTSDGRVREVAAGTGVITTIAGNGHRGSSGDGGSAIAAEVYPTSVKVDSSGNVYIANWPNEIRVVPAGGSQISAFAGIGFTGYSGDGGSATMAEFCEPYDLAFDASGSLYIADECNSRIRKVTFTVPAATPVFSLAAGTYLNTQSVTITDSTPHAAIYYTTDGTGPTPGSTLYGGPITVTQSETVRAIAVATGYNISPIGSAAYVIVPQAVPAVTWATPAPIFYGTPLSATQLNATASVPGTFAYNPGAGTILPIGSNSLSVTFTPTDIVDYTTATAQVSITVNPALPVLSALSPPIATAGGAAFTLTVNGSGFAAGAIVYWGSSPLTTTWVSATQVTAQAPASDIASAGINSVTVQNPGSGGGTSNALEFEADSSSGASPQFSTVTATVAPGSPASYTVTLPGSATNVSVQCLNLPAGATCSYSAASGAVTISTSTTTPAGTYQVTVVFNETLPGAASGLIFLPILLLPLVATRRKWARQHILLSALLAITITAVAATLGCGGGGSGGSTYTPPQTHTATSSGAVTLVVQ